MKKLELGIGLLCLSVILMFSACGDDEVTAPLATVDAGSDQTVELDEQVTLDGSSSTNVASYEWTVTDPNGVAVVLSDANGSMTGFTATLDGTYTATLIINGDPNLSDQVNIMVNNATFTRADYMGRPAINTVFNYFGTSGGKDNYNVMTLPSAPLAQSSEFEFILDNLQGYVGLNADTYTNALGLNNTQTSDVLIVDALNSDKNFPTTYGPSDLTDIRLFENVLNGRGLSDDVVDVTLILTFGGDLSSPPTGLIGDNVGYTSNSTDTFPYLGSPN